MNHPCFPLPSQKVRNTLFLISIFIQLKFYMGNRGFAANRAPPPVFGWPKQYMRNRHISHFFYG